MAVFREITVGQESQSTIDKHCLLWHFTVFSKPYSEPKSDAPCTGLLVRQVSIVFFGMFTLTSVSLEVGLDLMAECMAHTPRRIALLRDATLAGLLWHGLIWPLTKREEVNDVCVSC